MRADCVNCIMFSDSEKAVELAAIAVEILRIQMLEVELLVQVTMQLSMSRRAARLKEEGMQLQGRDLEQDSTLLLQLIPQRFLQLIHQLILPLWVKLKQNKATVLYKCNPIARNGLSGLT